MSGSKVTSTSVADPYLLTVSGHKFPLLRPTPQDVKLRDIAHSLGLMVRFNGHTKRLYTVAEHCILVALILRDQGHTPHVQMAGLLHDAAEAYIGDVPTPVKWAMDAVLPDKQWVPEMGYESGYYAPQAKGTTAFREIEGRVEHAIATRCGLSPEAFKTETMKLADHIALATEARDLLPAGIQWPQDLPKPHKMECDAAMHYMQLIHCPQLWKGRDDDYVMPLITPAELYRLVYLSLANERLTAR